MKYFIAYHDPAKPSARTVEDWDQRMHEYMVRSETRKGRWTKGAVVVTADEMTVHLHKAVRS